MTDTPALIWRLFEHLEWADTEVGRALGSLASPPAAAVREYAHVVGAEEIWLARLERRSSRLAIWSELTAARAVEEGSRVVAEYRALLASLGAGALDDSIEYTNSAGRSFVNARVDILVHVALHGQYHRGKVNLLLRQDGLVPAPTDYIAFVRGVPAATTVVVTRPSQT